MAHWLVAASCSHKHSPVITVESRLSPNSLTAFPPIFSRFYHFLIFIINFVVAGAAAAGVRNVWDGGARGDFRPQNGIKFNEFWTIFAKFQLFSRDFIDELNENLKKWFCRWL